MKKLTRRTAFTFSAVFIASSFAMHANAQDKPSAADAKVYFVGLSNGDTVTNPITLRFGLSGMGIAPAGLEGEQTANTGHHHLLIDVELTGEALTSPIPADDNHKHFGKGQTETTLSLPPGEHTLQLVLGDWTHIPHNKPVMSERITIKVQ
jgi:hypothetical protein